MSQLLGGSAREPGPVGRLQVQQLDRAARHESQRRVEIPADALVVDVHIPQVVRVLDPEPMRGGIGSEAVSPCRETPHAHGEILVPAKAGSRVREVGPGQPASAAAEWITNGRDRPH